MASSTGPSTRTSQASRQCRPCHTARDRERQREPTTKASPPRTAAARRARAPCRSSTFPRAMPPNSRSLLRSDPSALQTQTTTDRHPHRGHRAIPTVPKSHMDRPQSRALALRPRDTPQQRTPTMRTRRLRRTLNPHQASRVPPRCSCRASHSPLADRSCSSVTQSLTRTPRRSNHPSAPTKKPRVCRAF